MLRRDVLPLLGSAFLPAREVPDFRGRTLDGRSFQRDSFKGKPLLLQFWATWCKFCRRDETELEAFREEMGDRLNILAINVKESEQTVRAYLQEHRRRTPIVLSSETNLLQIFQPGGFPHYILLSANSEFLGDQSGAGGRPSLAALLRRAGL